MTDLTKEDFRLFIGREEQTISSLTFKARGPLRLGILIDMSGSRQKEMPGAELDAGTQFLKRLVKPGDQVFISAFNDKSYLVSNAFDNLQLLDDVLKRVTSARPYGGTALYDAIAEACAIESHGGSDHRAIVAITDGHDNASRLRPAQVIASAEGVGVSLYFIHLGQDGAQPGLFRVSNAGRREAESLGQISRTTGGIVFDVKDATEMRVAFDSVGELLRTQYAVDFGPAVQSGGKKKQQIKIKCTRPGVKIVAAEGY